MPLTIRPLIKILFHCECITSRGWNFPSCCHIPMAHAFHCHPLLFTQPFGPYMLQRVLSLPPVLKLAAFFTLTRSVLAHNSHLMPSRWESEMIYRRLQFFTTFTTRKGTASISAIGHIDNELQGNVSRQPSSFLRMRGLELLISASKGRAQFTG